jgi:hypothetical protein
MIDIPLDSHSTLKLPQIPLMDLQSSPLEFPPEWNSSLIPSLKYHASPLYFEANNIIIQYLMDGLGGGRCGGNKTPPMPPLNPWVAARYSPLHFPPNFHEISKKYLKLFPKYDMENAISTEEYMGEFQDFIDKPFCGAS